MFFEIENFSVSNLSVGHLEWPAAKHKVKPRAYDALAFRLRGEGSFLFDDGNKIESKEGEVLFVPRNMGYEVDYSDGEIIVFSFHMEPLFHRAERILSSSFKMAELFSEAYRIWKEKSPGSQMAAVGKFYEILAVFAAENSIEKNEDTAFCRAISFIEENYGDPDLRLYEICKRVGMSESVLRRKFAKNFGMSPVAYLTRIRLCAAEQMLFTENKTVEEVALECGFSDVKYFARVVKKHRGCTPSALRGGYK